jgi:hypothetical protein
MPSQFGAVPGWVPAVSCAIAVPARPKAANAINEAELRAREVERRMQVSSFSIWLSA